MNKNELIEAVRKAQAEAGVKVNAASTLNSKSKGELEALLADLSCGGCENGEHCGSCACCAEALAEQGEVAMNTEPEDTTPGNDWVKWNRKHCVAQLKAAGYEGPTSFLMPVLRDLTRLITEGREVEEALRLAKEGRKLR